MEALKHQVVSTVEQVLQRRRKALVLQDRIARDQGTKAGAGGILAGLTSWAFGGSRQSRSLAGEVGQAEQLLYRPIGGRG